MPKFFDDSDLVETDRDWIQKILFSPPTTDNSASSSSLKIAFAEFPFENQPVFDQTEAEDAACSPTSLGALSNSSGLGASSDNLAAITPSVEVTPCSLLTKQSMTSPRHPSSQPRFHNSGNHRPVRPSPRKFHNSGGGGSFQNGGSGRTPFLSFPPVPHHQQFLGSPVYFHPTQPAPQFGYFPYQQPHYAPPATVTPYSIPTGYQLPSQRLRTPPTSPQTHGAYGSPVFYGSAHQQMRHVASQNPYTYPQPFVHPAAFVNQLPMQMGNAPASFPTPLHSVQIRSPGAVDGGRETGIPPPPIAGPQEPDIPAPATDIPNSEEPEENNVGQEEAAEEDEIKSVTLDNENSGTVASDGDAVTLEEKEKETEVALDVEVQQEISIDNDDSATYSFGNFADLDIVLPVGQAGDEGAVMEFGVKKEVVEEVAEPDKVHSHPLSPESLVPSDASGTDIFFDAEEEKNEEKVEEEKFEVCPESPKESRKSSSTDSTELSGEKQKCWASLFRNTKQAAEAVVVSKPETTTTPTTNKDSPPWTKKVADEPTIVPFEKDIAKLEVQNFVSETELTHRGPAYQLRGLVNTGNWCYVNAVLQSLLACPPFFHLMHQFKRLSRRSPTSTPIFDALSGFVGEFVVEKRFMTKRGVKDVSIGPSINPLSIQKIAQRLRADSSFKGRQEDAEEFLLALLNGLHEEMVKCTPRCEKEVELGGETGQEENADEWQQVGPGRKSAITRQTKCSTSLVSQIFFGQLRYSLNQPGCKESVNVEHFFTFPLEIQDASITDVQSAMNYFFRKETVKCANKTKIETEGIRRGSFHDLPIVLVIQLKYFVYAGDSVKKLPKTIGYDMDLQIPKEHMAPGGRGVGSSQRSYKLFSVVFHHGEEAVGGHYTAKIFHGGQWVEADDSRVTPLYSSEDVLKLRPHSVPYLLFYRRCDLMQQQFR